MFVCVCVCVCVGVEGNLMRGRQMYFLNPIAAMGARNRAGTKKELSRNKVPVNSLLQRNRFLLYESFQMAHLGRDRGHVY